jgi:hypothetical protein
MMLDALLYFGYVEEVLGVHLYLGLVFLGMWLELGLEWA